MEDKNSKIKIENNSEVSNGKIKKEKTLEISGNKNIELKTLNNKKNNTQKLIINFNNRKNNKKEILQLNQKKSNSAINSKTTHSKKAIIKNKSTIFQDSGMQGKQVKVLKRDNTGKILVGLSTISLVLIMIVVGQFFILESKDPSNSLFQGTIINGIDVGGMDFYDAEKMIYDVFKDKSENFKLRIVYNDKFWEFDKSDFKVNSEIHTIIEEAQKREIENNNYENQTKTIERLKREGVSLNVAFNYIFVGLDDKIDNIIKEIEIEPIDSKIEFANDVKNVFNITEHKDGLRVNKEQLYYDINEQFNKTNNIVVEIKTIKEKAKVTKQDNLSLTKEIASFKTMVADSTGARKNNVKLALKKFDNFVLMPNQEVSFNKVTGPHTLENGYKIATIIYNGQFVDGVGGGICQASTTLYNALLLANVEIIEVHKHTLPVKYVPLATDAMVSEYVADLKFKNTSEYPIYIKTYADSESVSVKLFSKEQEIKIKLKTEFVRTIAHKGDEIKFDDKKEYTNKVLFKGEQFRLKYPRNGYEAKVYLEYYKNNKKIDEKLIRHEIYTPQKGVIIEGALDVPAGMEIIDGQIKKIEASSQNDEMNNNKFVNYIPTNVCP